MKKLTKSALWVLALSFAALFSCNDPSVLGSDLLSGDELDIAFTDTLTLEARTVLSDSLRVWDASTTGVDIQNFSLGDMQDPIFGRSVSSIYAQIVTNTAPPDFEGKTLDSVVLMLAYNPALCYGKLDEPYTIEVYEMSQSLEATEVYYTTDSFSVKPTPLAIETFVPNIEDSLTLIVPQGDPDTVVTEKLPPHLRIRLDNTAMDPIFQLDSLTLSDDTLFVEFFKGIWLKPASQNAGMLNFAMRNINTNIRFYYHEGETYGQYNFRSYAGTPVTMHQRNYYSGSYIEPYISQDGEERNDSILFLQGLNGVNIEFEIPYAEALNGIIINKAELILPILTLPEDTDDYDAVAQIYATEVLTDTSLADIGDIYLLPVGASSDILADYFGGTATEDDNYKISLSAHFQRMISGESGKKLLFTAYLKQERAARVVLGGPGHSTHPAKLRITYSRY